MPDLPIKDVTPNAVHLQRTDNNDPMPMDGTDVPASDLKFHITPFAHLEHITMTTMRGEHPAFGIQCIDDELLQRARIKDVSPNSDAALVSSSPKASRPLTIILSSRRPMITWLSKTCRMRGCASQQM